MPASWLGQPVTRETGTRSIEPVTGGIINPLVYEHRSVRAQLASMLDRLITLLDASDAGVREAAVQYRNSDRATAGRLDDSYPVVQRPSLRTS